MSEPSAEARALEIELHGCTCLPQHSGISEAMILMKGSVRLCQEHEDIARALDAKDVRVQHLENKLDDQERSWQATMAAKDVQVAEARREKTAALVRLLGELSCCYACDGPDRDDEELRHNEGCYVAAALASSPGAAR